MPMYTADGSYIPEASSTGGAVVQYPLDEGYAPNILQRLVEEELLQWDQVSEPNAKLQDYL